MEPLERAISFCTKAEISVKALKKILKTADEYSSSEPTVINADLIRPVIVGNGGKFLLLNHLKAGDKVLNPFGREKIIFFGIDLDSHEIKAIAIAKKELCSSDTWNSLIQEIKIMKLSQGVEGIIQMDLAFFLGARVFIVLEYYNAGQLGELLIALMFANLDLRLRLKLALDIAIGLKNLHDLGILHRDIKPQNIFVYDKHEETPHAVLADLGSACEMKDFKEMKKFTGSYAWFSPEIAKTIEPGETETKVLPGWLETMTDKADVWGLGCVFFLLFKGGSLSWQRVLASDGRGRQVAKNTAKLKEKKVIEEIKNSPLDPKLKLLITGMLQVNPEKRWSALEVYEFLSDLV